MEPTNRQAENALNTRNVGARLAQGPWQRLPKGQWAVPAVAYLSLAVLPDVILGLSGSRWGAVGRVKRESDEQELIWG